VSSKNSKWSLGRTLQEALTLDAHFYEDAHRSSSSQRLALTVVILAAVSNALGSAFILLINRVSPTMFVIALAINAISVVIGYYFWTLTTWQLGQWFKPNHASFRELLIPIGFAYAPQVLNFLTLIPLLGRPIQLGLAVWSLLAVIVAVRQGLDISTIWAASICLVGWPLVQVAVGLVQIFEL